MKVISTSNDSKQYFKFIFQQQQNLKVLTSEKKVAANMYD